MTAEATLHQAGALREAGGGPKGGSGVAQSVGGWPVAGYNPESKGALKTAGFRAESGEELPSRNNRGTHGWSNPCVLVVIICHLTSCFSISTQSSGLL